MLKELPINLISIANNFPKWYRLAFIFRRIVKCMNVRIYVYKFGYNDFREKEEVSPFECKELFCIDV